jgi:outer membrane lipoprotein
VRGAFLAVCSCAFLLGCAGVISPQIRDEAVELESFSQLREEPESYRGRTVILGGKILQVRNEPGGSVLLIRDEPLGFGQRPESGRGEYGRFLARFDNFLEPLVFAPGREVTVAGVVNGVVTEPVGAVKDHLVLLEGREIHLWQQTAQVSYPEWHLYEPWYLYESSYPAWYDPYWGSRPW